jgi:hypothetical protein
LSARRPKRYAALAALVVATLVLAAACGGDGDDDGAGPTTTAAAGDGNGATDPSKALTVGQALGIGPSEVKVRGFLFAEDGGRVLLCNSLVGTPAQCGGPFLEVQGLDMATVPGVQPVEGASPPARFTPEELVLTGVVQVGLMTVTQPPGAGGG